MPISVPRWAKAELEEAIQVAKRAGYAMAGRDFYSYVMSHLRKSGVPAEQHDGVHSVPDEHVYWKP